MKAIAPRTSISGKALPAVLTFVQIAGIIGLVTWAILLKRDVQALQEQLKAERARPAPTNNLQNENRALRSQVAELQQQLSDAKLAAVVAPTPPPPAATPNPAPAAPANPIAALAATMNNPAMRNLVASTQKRILETRYADLFAQLQFSPEQRARFLDVLSETQSSATDVGLKLLTGNLSPAEQATIRQQAKEIDANTDAKMREFFGDDAKFAAYKQYNEQQAERTQVSSLKTTLGQSGLPGLTNEQAAALTDIMYSERKNFVFTPPPAADAANPMAMSAAAIEARMRDQTTLNDQIANRAATVLSPEQLAALRRDQANRVESLKTSSDFMRQMLGGAQPAAK